MTMMILAVTTGTSVANEAETQPSWHWETASAQTQVLSQAKLEAAWNNLVNRHTTAFLVVRNDKIVFERYAPAIVGPSRTTPPRWPRPWSAASA